MSCLDELDVYVPLAVIEMVTSQDDEIERLRAELEIERMRLVACGVVALANTADSAATARVMHPDYRSGSLESVEQIVDENIELRSELEKLRTVAQSQALQTLTNVNQELMRGNVMGRIAIELFGSENNRSDEECVEKLKLVRRDAERYRWLRGDSCQDHSLRWMQWEVRCWQAPRWSDDLRRLDLDAAVDAAMKEQKE